MKKIVLLCAAGSSTSMLVSKMRSEAENQNIECEIDAYAFREAESGERKIEANVVLLGPQIRFKLAKAKEMFPDSHVEAIDMRLYGTMNAKAVLEGIKDYLNEK